jgi:hypothetical protein
MPSSEIVATLMARIEPLQAWLCEEAAEACEAARHLDSGTQERAYWHIGYHAALTDIAAMLAEQRVRSPDTTRPCLAVAQDAGNSPPV